MAINGGVSMKTFIKKSVLKLFIFAAALFFCTSCKKQSLLPAQDNANLAFLFFSSGAELEEKFSPEKYEYNLKIKKKTQRIVILAVTENPKSKYSVSVYGITLPVSVVSIPENLPVIEFEIMVTAPSGNKKTYKIKAKKEGTPLPEIPPGLPTLPLPIS